MRFVGIIPAHAGNTILTARGPDASRDHPRACGEHPKGFEGGRDGRGSSPRMRGTHPLRAVPHIWAGIIPAHAGNTPVRCRSAVSKQGSSPRMRGTRCLVGRVSVAHGIIPAHAGNTKEVMRCSSASWDHPRACGEHQVLQTAIAGLPGSSPRMRGTPPITKFHGALRGIIPAHAGNTRCRANGRSPGGDHPRACGEHRAQRVAADPERGSSPRMRGTRCAGRLPRLFGGIIPAHAGNTLACRQKSIDSRDHPRACGEHLLTVSCSSRATGSSPRMRGTQAPAASKSARPGIIPAHAGNTL